MQRRYHTHTHTRSRASLLCSHAPPTSACECLSDLYCVQSKQRERGKPCRQQDERQTDRDRERERDSSVWLNVETVLSELQGKLCMCAAVRLRDAATLAARAACLPLLVRGKPRPAFICSEWACFSIWPLTSSPSGVSALLIVHFFMLLFPLFRLIRLLSWSFYS